MNNSLIEKINLAFGIIMVLVYFAVGIFILFYNFVILNSVDINLKKAAGILIIIYAFYRLFRTIKKFRRKDEDEADE